MHDNTGHLVKMANGISNFFRLRPEEQAVAGTANHIKRFWEPRMRAKIAEHAQAGGHGLSAAALAAAKLLAPAPVPAKAGDV